MTATFDNVAIEYPAIGRQGIIHLQKVWQEQIKIPMKSRNTECKKKENARIGGESVL